MSDNAGLDAAALALSAMAAANAAEAARKADRAERLAFVKGFRHNDSTLEERRYYAESVYILWPEEEEGHDPIAVMLIAFGLLGIVAAGWLAYAEIGHRHGPDFWVPFILALVGGVVAGVVVLGALAALRYLLGAVWPWIRRHWLLLALVALGAGVGGYALWSKRQHDARIERQSAYIGSLPRCPERASQVTEDCMRDNGMPFFVPPPVYYCPREIAARLGCDPGRDGEVWQRSGQ